jgi:hypothetical protein
MPTEKIKLTGQLITDSKPVVLIVSDKISEIGTTAKRYKQVFPDIFLTAEWGYFKTPISEEKRRALSTLMYGLKAPLGNLVNSLR